MAIFTRDTRESSYRIFREQLRDSEHFVVMANRALRRDDFERANHLILSAMTYFPTEELERLAKEEAPVRMALRKILRKRKGEIVAREDIDNHKRSLLRDKIESLRLVYQEEVMFCEDGMVAGEVVIKPLGDSLRIDNDQFMQLENAVFN